MKGRDHIGVLFGEAYNNHADAIYRYCYFKTSSQEMGKELLQETFTRSFAYAAAGNEIKNIRAFLYKVAKNLIINWYSVKNRTVSLDAVSDREFIREPVVENSAIQGAEAGEALEAIEHLQGLDREIFVLRYVEDLSVKEIAKIVNKSENAVSVRINRGIQKIRKMLEVDHGSKSERGRESFEGQRATTSKGAQAN